MVLYNLTPVTSYPITYIASGKDYVAVGTKRFAGPSRLNVFAAELIPTMISVFVLS
jgi:hypothetical protein